MCYSVVRFSNNQSISLLISTNRDSQDGESRLCEMSHYRIHQQVSKKNIQRLTHAQKRARNKKGKKENEEKKAKNCLIKKKESTGKDIRRTIPLFSFSEKER